MPHKLGWALPAGRPIPATIWTCGLCGTLADWLAITVDSHFRGQFRPYACRDRADYTTTGFLCAQNDGIVCVENKFLWRQIVAILHKCWKGNPQARICAQNSRAISLSALRPFKINDSHVINVMRKMFHYWFQF